MYNVTVDELVGARLAALPNDRIAVFGGMLAELTIDPWGRSSCSYTKDPRDPMRAVPFGDGCMIMYMINESKNLVRVFDIVAL